MHASCSRKQDAVKSLTLATKAADAAFSTAGQQAESKSRSCSSNPPLPLPGPPHTAASTAGLPVYTARVFAERC